MSRQHDMDAVLALWAGGEPAKGIAKALGISSGAAVMDLVRKARMKGDPRATARYSRAGSVTPRQPERGPEVSPIPSPDYSNLTPFGFLMGDPPAGRSALDRKRAGVSA